MRNNKLKKNLKKVGCAIFTFFFGYVVIGFFLKSTYPIQEQLFNGVIAYELIRDGLTLSAYFLAPTIAVLLFSNWREEYVEKEIELESFNLYNNLCNLINDWYEFKTDIWNNTDKCKRYILDIKEHTFLKRLEEIRANNELLEYRSKKSKLFTKKVSEFCDVIHRLILKNTQVLALRERFLTPELFTEFYKKNENNKQFKERMKYEMELRSKEMTIYQSENLHGYKPLLFSLMKRLKINANP